MEADDVKAAAERRRRWLAGDLAAYDQPGTDEDGDCFILADAYLSLARPDAAAVRDVIRECVREVVAMSRNALPMGYGDAAFETIADKHAARLGAVAGADDGTPTDDAWMKSTVCLPLPGFGIQASETLSFFNSSDGWGLYFHGGYGDALEVVDEDGDSQVGAIRIADAKTRGAVRDLCRCLGIALNESPT